MTGPSVTGAGLDARTAPAVDLGRSYLAAHPPPGRVLLCAVTGSHIYGFPSPDSDIDLKGVHLAPTRRLLGLGRPTETHDRTEHHQGIECDLTTNEAGPALDLVLAGNGNMLERILSPLQLVAGPEVAQLQALARGAISARAARHYGGFFRGCQREHERRPTAKAMLYSYRVALTGIHLLVTGELETDVTLLAPRYRFDDVVDLVVLKGEGAEHGPLPEALDRHHRARWPVLAARLADAEGGTHLPAEAPNRAEVDAWLVSTRLADLERADREQVDREQVDRAQP